MNNENDLNLAFLPERIPAGTTHLSRTARELLGLLPTSHLQVHLTDPHPSHATLGQDRRPSNHHHLIINHPHTRILILHQLLIIINPTIPQVIPHSHMSIYLTMSTLENENVIGTENASVSGKETEIAEVTGSILHLP